MSTDKKDLADDLVEEIELVLGDEEISVKGKRVMVVNVPDLLAEDEEEEEEEEEEEKAVYDYDEDEDEDEDDEKKAAREAKAARRTALLDQLAALDEEDEDEDAPVPTDALVPTLDDDDEEEEEEEGNRNPLAILRRAKVKRLMDMGLGRKDAKTLRDTDYVCAIDRKVYPNEDDVCDFCRGGCASEKDLPGLLDVEAYAEMHFKADVLDSGYAPNNDMYVIDLKTAEGPIEAFYSGEGERLGWLRLEEEGGIEGKSAEIHPMEIISFDEAQDIALKHVTGTVLGVDVDIFQGQDSYVVEVDGSDGKSYDVYVGIDGALLGYDHIDLNTTEEDTVDALEKELRAIEAEIELKRDYTDDRRDEYADKGWALPDGSYPIRDVGDLKNAIQAFGRAKDKGKVRAHIMKRAAALDASDLIPENWAEKSDEDAMVAALMEFELLEAEQDLNDSGF